MKATSPRATKHGKRLEGTLSLWTTMYKARRKALESADQNPDNIHKKLGDVISCTV